MYDYFLPLILRFVFYGLQIKTLGGQDKYTKGLKKSVGSFKQLLPIAKDFVFQQEDMNKAATDLDKLFGDIGATVHDAISSLSETAWEEMNEKVQ